MCSDKDAVQETKSVASGRPCRKISTYWWAGGLALSAAFCTAVMTPLLHMRVYEPLAAVVLALLVAVLAVRALGQTDLNPVSGVGKLSQVRSEHEGRPPQPFSSAHSSGRLGYPSGFKGLSWVMLP